MEIIESIIVERESRETSEENHANVSQKLVNSISRYYNSTPETITKRLQELEKEWDLEKVLQMNASTLALTGMVFGTLFNKRWFLLSGLVAGFLFLHEVQGRPPLSFLKSLGFRTREEIDEEIFALKALRGDFENLPGAGPEEMIRRLRKSEKE